MLSGAAQGGHAGRWFPMAGEAGRMCVEFRLSVRFKVSSVLVEPWAFGQVSLKLPGSDPPPAE